MLAEQWFATIDGFIPLFDPYSNYYDPSLDRIKWSQLAGASFREALLLWTGTGVASSIMGPERWAAASVLEKAVFKNMYFGILVEARLPQALGFSYTAANTVQLIGTSLSSWDTFNKVYDLIDYEYPGLPVFLIPYC